MSNFTTGFLTVTIAQLDTTASLASLRDELITRRPSYRGLISGWGSIHDDPTNLGEFAPAPPAADPTMEPAVGYYPERLFARFYYWAPDRNARRYAGAGVALQQISRLRACDFMFARTSPTSVTVAISSRKYDDLDTIFKPAVQAATLSVDTKSNLLLDTSPLDLGSSDIFMWLLQRYDEDRQLTAQLELANMREINGRDPLSRATSLSQGVDLSRRELLALITNVAIEFGPAKLVTFESTTDALLDIQLFIDGGFAVHTGGSHYKQVMGRTAIGPRAVEDLVFVIIPSLRTAYQQDKPWHDGGRQAFIDKCAKTLRK